MPRSLAARQEIAPVDESRAQGRGKRLETRQNAFNLRFALRHPAATDTMFAWLMRGGAVWQLVGLITRRS
jgi:hypothetical protein